MLARRSNRASFRVPIAIAFAGIGLGLGLGFGSAACTDGTTPDCSDAQCQMLVEMPDKGAAEGGDDGSADAATSVDGESSADAGSDAGDASGVDGASSVTDASPGDGAPE
jgi:hypothetical protein